MKKFWKKVLAGSLAVVCTLTAGVAAIATNGFGLFNNAAQVEQTDHNKQLSFGNFFGNGIMLTASAAEASPYAGLVELDFTLYAAKCYMSNESLELTTNNNFWATEKFTKETLPIGSKIVIAEGWQYRPEGWVNDQINASYNDRPASVTTAEVEVTEEWWGNWTTRGFNIALATPSALNTYTEDQIREAFKIYVPGSTPSTPVNGVARLTATITPETATNQKVDWSVAWKNPSSTWASGKTVTDYVTVTPTSDGALTADVECKQAFGEQVQVIVTSRADTSLSASCTADYAKRIQKISFVHSSDGTGTHTTNDSSFILNVGFDYTVGPYNSPTYEYSVGTIEDTFNFSIMFYAKNDSAILADIQSETGYSFTIDSAYISGRNIAMYNLAMMSVFGLNATKKAEIAALESYFYNHPETDMFSVKIMATGAHSTFVKTLPVRFNLEALYEAVETVELSGSNILF